MDFRSLALSLPEATEKETWGHPTFRVRDRMFASAASDLSTATVKSTLDEQRALTQSDPDTFFVPAYVGKHGWIGIHLDGVDPDELHELVVEAWRMTAPKRLVKAWDEEHPLPRQQA
jgi:hypothetical protein